MEVDSVVLKARENVSKLYHLFSEHCHCNQWTKEAVPLSQDCGILEMESVKAIARRARDLMKEEPNVLHMTVSASSPVVVIGDIHGQCCDLKTIFQSTHGLSLIHSDHNSSGSSSDGGERGDCAGDDSHSKTVEMNSESVSSTPNGVGEWKEEEEFEIDNEIRPRVRSGPGVCRKPHRGRAYRRYDRSKTSEDKEKTPPLQQDSDNRTECNGVKSDTMEEEEEERGSSNSSEDGIENECPLKLSPEMEQKYLFLGDYVDRGSYSCEVILFLLSLKVAHPQRVFLLRGNHESRCMTARVYLDCPSFLVECEKKVGEEAYESFMEAFDALPLAAVLNTSLGRWFCCHGGLGPKLQTLSDLEKIDRFAEPPLTGLVCDLLWADPLLEEVLGFKLSDKDYADFLELDFMPNPPRGCSYFYGNGAIEPFLKSNQLLGIVRAHQCKEQGVGFTYADNRILTYMWPFVTTVFSASNYCGSHGNHGAVVLFYKDDIQILKMNQHGDTWVEYAPYHSSGFNICSSQQKEQSVEEKEEEKEEEEEISILEPIKDETVAKETKNNAADVKAPEEVKKAAEKPRKRVVISAPEKDKEETEKKKEVEEEVEKFSPSIARRPQRSLTVHYDTPPLSPKNKDLRRQSMVMLRKGLTGEGGSLKFRAALRKDLVYEIHPGWESIKKLSKVVGRIQLMRKSSVERVTSPTQTSAKQEDTEKQNATISNKLLSLVGKTDSHQLRLVFNSIDSNGDGQLSFSELNQFALELGKCHSEELVQEVEKLLEDMDADRSGTVSFEEFTNYMASLSQLDPVKDEDKEEELPFPSPLPTS